MRSTSRSSCTRPPYIAGTIGSLFGTSMAVKVPRTIAGEDQMRRKLVVHGDRLIALDRDGIARGLAFERAVME